MGWGAVRGAGCCAEIAGRGVHAGYADYRSGVERVDARERAGRKHEAVDRNCRGSHMAWGENNVYIILHTRRLSRIRWVMDVPVKQRISSGHAIVCSLDFYPASYSFVATWNLCT